MRTLAEKERKNTAKFWIEYHRQLAEIELASYEAQQQMYEDNAPSRLGFGLL